MNNPIKEKASRFAGSPTVNQHERSYFTYKYSTSGSFLSINFYNKGDV